MSKLHYISLYSKLYLSKVDFKRKLSLNLNLFTNSKAVRKNTVFKDIKNVSGASLEVQWLRLCAVSIEIKLGSIPGLGTRSHQLCGVPKFKKERRKMSQDIVHSFP